MTSNDRRAPMPLGVRKTFDEIVKKSLPPVLFSVFPLCLGTKFLIYERSGHVQLIVGYILVGGSALWRFPKRARKANIIDLDKGLKPNLNYHNTFKPPHHRYPLLFPDKVSGQTPSPVSFLYFSK